MKIYLSLLLILVVSIVEAMENKKISKYSPSEFSYKSKYTLDERLAKSKKISANHPNSVPTILEYYDNRTNSNKYLHTFVCEKKMKFLELNRVIRDRVDISKADSLQYRVGNKHIHMDITLGALQYEHKDEDGFLYVVYNLQQTFG